MGTNVSWMYYDYFTMYANIKALCCTPEINVIFQSYLKKMLQ